MMPNTTTCYLPEPAVSALVLRAKRGLLKHAAGTHIFCQTCERVLDAKTTVNVTLRDVSKTVCATCWDAHLKPAIEARGNGLLGRCDVLDGRVLFKRARS
jgi:hypothetical protein